MSGGAADRGSGYPCPMPSVVLVLPKSGSRNEDFIAAARRLGVEVIPAGDVCHQLADLWADSPLALPSHDVRAAADALAREAGPRGPVSILGVDDLTSLVAALASARLGLPHNPPGAVASARNKSLSRGRLRDAGLPAPWFEVVPRDLAGPELDAFADRVPFPVVVKP